MHVTVLPGDGVGPEVTAQAMAVLREVEELWHLRIETAEFPIGGAAIDAAGDPLPTATLEAAQKSDAVFLGAVGGPRWDAGAKRPEEGLLRLRRELEVFANLRPIRAVPYLTGPAPVRPEIHRTIQYVIVRELTGGLYFGESGRVANGCYDTMVYRRSEIARVTRVAFALAAAEGSHVTLVDKANVLSTSRLWREVVGEVASEYPYVTYETELVDSCAMHLVQDPGRYGVILTENLFGDILSDLGAGTLGSLGLLPSASLGSRGPGLYEPVHGSAPDIAGRNLANPLGAIGAVAMMLRYSLGAEEAAQAVEASITDVLADGLRTKDIAASGQSTVGTDEMGQAVCRALDRHAKSRNQAVIPLG